MRVARAIIVVQQQAWIGILWLAAVTACHAAPELWLAHSAPHVSLTERMQAGRIPADAPQDPEQLWNAAASQPVEAGKRWHVVPGEATVGRVTLLGTRERDTYVVLVPLPWVDEVQVWYREQGNGWKGAVAGDRVALSRWPYPGTFPAFPIPLREKPLDLIVSVANDGPLGVPVWIMPDPVFRENQIRQSSLSGVVIGLGLMITMVCLIGGAILRRGANWLLAGVTGWALVAVVCVNGYMALWLTPEWPAFNDTCKHFVSVVLAGLMVALVAESLDERYLTRGGHLLKWLAPALGLAYGIVQALWLPPPWRVPGGVAWAVACMMACIALCLLSVLQGGRYVQWIAAAIGCVLLGIGLAYVPLEIVGGMDLRAAGVGGLLFAASLLIRQALYSRERYGRDVLGRAAISANRDPLTALLSYSGFQEAFEGVALRQGAGQGCPSVMLFMLPGLERSNADHGFVLSERALVRFAACLHRVLGNSWSIGRLSKARFACVSAQSLDHAQLQALATQVLAECARVAEPLAPVSDFDLRIAARVCRQLSAGFATLLTELEEAGRAMEAGKRIVLL